MATFNYSEIFVSNETAATIASDLFGITGTIRELPGEVDMNFRIIGKNGTYLLKVSRPGIDVAYIDFQQQILGAVAKSKEELVAPKVLNDLDGHSVTHFVDEHENKRAVRLLTWIDGRLWSSINPVTDALLVSLGQRAGLLSKALTGFDHPQAHRELEWDIAQAGWTGNHTHLFKGGNRSVVENFLDRFEERQLLIKSFRKAVVHNDVNDNNIVVSEDLLSPQVEAIIDFGDAIYTSIINDLAIAIAYGIMGKPDPLAAALCIVKGYNSTFPLLDDELAMLHLLVAMRLIITVTKAAQNKIAEPDNAYLVVSEKPAWDSLNAWAGIDEKLGYYSFRAVCGLEPYPQNEKFVQAISRQQFQLADLFPSLNISMATNVDMSVGSTWLGGKQDYSDPDLGKFHLAKLQRQNPGSVVGGGYGEIRPFYSTSAFEMEGNNGPEYRTAHLGIDFWVAAGTPIHAFLDGEVHSIVNNEGDKNYGPTLILKHRIGAIGFFTLYGHLSTETLELVQKGQVISKGVLIGTIGNELENGHWIPHLHFQVILDMMEFNDDFPGVGFPNRLDVWKSICPNPNLLFKENGLISEQFATDDVQAFRAQHLGKGLSLSYEEPLKMLRGDGAFLIDETGRRYLDTVNNVAHVGHEHARVVRAGQEQMAVLNTNSRYLHDNINEFAKKLLSTFPEELSVVHFVNSGSEANELALRMAKAATGQKDVIAIEGGYHGNTNANINISSYKFDGKGGAGSPEHTRIVPLPDAYRGRFQGDDTGKKYGAYILERVKQVQENGRNVAAFICESIISCGGQIELPEGYLNRAYNYVRDAGGVCIADEVQVGCGRLGRAFWGFQLHGVIPDIVTIGKPIGNGHPVAAVVCTKVVSEAFANGMEYFNTFGGNPVSCAIGAEVLKVIKDEGLQQNALEVGNYLKNKLRLLQKEFSIIGDVRGQGLFLGFELNKLDKTPLPSQAAYLVNRMKELGILMSTDGLDNNVIKIKPPMVFSKDNANELVFRLKSVFAEDYMKIMKGAI